ncbi:L-histidine N(alpha)-methyltransferase [Pontibacter arcticus]|nr:L-histidine N(alpha)-methyltransferase [Pontibacter arcticus]
MTLLPIDLSIKQDGTADTAAFAKDVLEGLSRTNKKLSSRYFYDKEGSRLFQKIMHLSEYYPTRCEHEVLTGNKQDIISKFAGDSFFHLIDLGAGDALKTKILLRELDKQKKQFDYVPVDISGDAMHQLNENLQQELPNIEVQAVVGEYFKALEWLHENKAERKVVLFLGSNIGNFEDDESIDFLKKIRSYLNTGDKLFMGVDLRKSPDVILPAYNDASGVTAAFNLNLLQRINQELGANFDLTAFQHSPIYHPQKGVMKSYLVSTKAQEVHIKALNKTFSFDAWEAIHTENSHKYSLKQVEELGLTCGFTVEAVFQDEASQFADVLFTVK